MANANPFATAHYAQIALDKQIAKRIQFVYAQAAKDIKQQIKTLKIINPSDNLKKVYLDGLMKDVNNSIASLEKELQGTILSASEASGKLAVEAGNAYMKKCGLDLAGAYSYVPQQEIKNIVSGKLYGDKWSLSHSIWKAGLRTKSDVEKMVAKGLAENKSIKDIANDITKYVDPTARKPWDWNKVYPGTAAKVDYNAQRLARTMIQHSYERSLVQSQMYNPFCHGIIWHSVGEHGRTCALCLDRDGQVYPVKDLPLDHPNGLCYFEPDLDSMDKVADRLADWANGGSDPALDNYVAQAFGLNPKSAAAQKAVQAAKVKTAQAAPVKSAASVPFDKTAFVDNNFGKLKKVVIASQNSKAEGEKIWAALRGHMITLDETQLKYMGVKQKFLPKIWQEGNKGYFSPGQGICVNLSRDMADASGRGAFSTFFHEYGHFCDHAAYANHKNFFTYNEEFKNELYFSLQKEYNKLCGKHGLKSSVYDALYNNNRTSGIQDAISGLSMNKDRVLWGHPTSYWQQQGQVKGTVIETVANFNAAWADPKNDALMKKYFPESYQMFKDQVKSYVSQVKIKWK